MFGGWPYVDPPEKQKKAVIRPSFIPKPESIGFETTAISCVPCGVRMSMDEIEWTRFLTEHGPHMRAFLDAHRTVRPTWRRPR